MSSGKLSSHQPHFHMYRETKSTFGHELVGLIPDKIQYDWTAIVSVPISVMTSRIFTRQPKQNRD